METKYKRKLRHLFGGWSETHESTRGSGFGFPDLQFLVNGRLVPVEVKRGELKGNVLKTAPIRPSQITWHDTFLKHGGLSFLVICSGALDEMNAWALPSVRREFLAEWRKGWPVHNCIQLIKNGKLMINLRSLVLNMGKPDKL